MLLLDALERHVLADRHVAAVLMAAGAKDVTLPQLQDARDAFDGSLFAAADAIDTEQQELHRALGVV